MSGPSMVAAGVRDYSKPCRPASHAPAPLARRWLPTEVLWVLLTEASPGVTGRLFIVSAVTRMFRIRRHFGPPVRCCLRELRRAGFLVGSGCGATRLGSQPQGDDHPRIGSDERATPASLCIEPNERQLRNMPADVEPWDVSGAKAVRADDGFAQPPQRSPMATGGRHLGSTTRRSDKPGNTDERAGCQRDAMPGPCTDGDSGAQSSKMPALSRVLSSPQRGP
jgi:hypothetical protein